MRRPEQALQIAVAAYLRLALNPPVLWSAFPSGGGGKVRGAFLKAMGLAPGWPDLIVIAPRGLNTVVIGLELKAAKGRASPEQKLVRDAFHEAGAHYIVCKSIDDVSLALRAMGIPLSASVARAA